MRYETAEAGGNFRAARSAMHIALANWPPSSPGSGARLTTESSLPAWREVRVAVAAMREPLPGGGRVNNLALSRAPLR